MIDAVGRSGAHALDLPRHPEAQQRPARGNRETASWITPSHNPPEDGGFKIHPPTGGPAQTDVTRWIEDRANELLSGRLRNVVANRV